MRRVQSASVGQKREATPQEQVSIDDTWCLRIIDGPPKRMLSESTNVKCRHAPALHCVNASCQCGPNEICKRIAAYFHRCARQNDSAARRPTIPCGCVQFQRRGLTKTNVFFSSGRWLEAVVNLGSSSDSDKRCCTVTSMSLIHSSVTSPAFGAHPSILPPPARHPTTLTSYQDGRRSSSASSSTTST